jgi:hypothetical protein|tara:strand:- start:1812 stop:2372 length:561 start_codon:yes stop_codon:yes gene_type:complete
MKQETNKNIMDFKKLNQPVELSQIDFRVQSINKGGYATILAYKDARYDMNVLDKAVGPENWSKRYEVIDGRLYCSVGIYNGATKEWVWKQDVGTESNTEAEKGQASDAFKRACFNWGIGRELYDFPLIQAKLDSSEFQEVGGRPKATWGLKLKEWTWGDKRDENGQLVQLAAKDQNGKVRFNWKKN